MSERKEKEKAEANKARQLYRDVTIKLLTYEKELDKTDYAAVKGYLKTLLDFQEIVEEQIKRTFSIISKTEFEDKEDN